MLSRSTERPRLDVMQISKHLCRKFDCKMFPVFI